MSQTIFLSPEQIKEYNTVFVESLYQLNNLAHQQRLQILEEASYIIREISRATPSHLSESDGELANFESELAKKKESLSTKSAVLTPDTENTATQDGVPFYDNLVRALNNAQENAVNNQNQANILAQASLTQGIMQMYSIGDVKEAVAMEEKTEHMYSSPEQH